LTKPVCFIYFEIWQHCCYFTLRCIRKE